MAQSFFEVRMKSEPPVNRWLAQPLKGATTDRAPKGAQKV